MSPLVAALGALHGTVAVRAQLALGLDVEEARAAHPGTGGDGRDAIAGLKKGIN